MRSMLVIWGTDYGETARIRGLFLKCGIIPEEILTGSPDAEELRQTVERLYGCRFSLDLSLVALVDGESGVVMWCVESPNKAHLNACKLFL